MYLLRACTVWLVIMVVESAHGTLREMFLAPLVGSFRARQVAVFTGSLLILGVACLLVRWMRAINEGQLLLVGLLWVDLTLLFEFCVARPALGYSWEQALTDYDLSRGGLMPLGLLLMALAPLLAARLRGTETFGGLFRTRGAPAAGRT